MKKGTIEYIIRTERKKSEDSSEKFLLEYAYKARGFDYEDSFDTENPNSELVERIKLEHIRILNLNPNILRYESKLVEKLSPREKVQEKSLA